MLEWVLQPAAQVHQVAQAHQLPDGAVAAVAESEQREQERQKRSHEIGADRVVKSVPNTMCETERG